MSETSPLQKLNDLCPMRKREFTFGTENLTLWTTKDIDPLLDRMMSKHELDPEIADDQMPYWAELWPSSLLMAEVLVNQAPKLPEGEFFEMGCGPALPGILAARLGKQGTVSDYLEEALWLAELNVKENGVSDQVKIQRMDWREPLSKKVPWILANDVAYEKRAFRPLVDCWNDMLAPGGQIWLSEPGRSVAKGFFQLLEEEQWQTEVIGTKERVRVLRIRPPGN